MGCFLWARSGLSISETLSHLILITTIISIILQLSKLGLREFNPDPPDPRACPLVQHVNSHFQIQVYQLVPSWSLRLLLKIRIPTLESPTLESLNQNQN